VSAPRFVRHSRKPEWGIGKLDEGLGEGPPYRYAFADGETRAFPEQSLSLLTHVDPFEAEREAAQARAAAAAAAAAGGSRRKQAARPDAPPPERASSLERQIEIFLTRYPAGFEDEKFVEDERGVPGTRKAGRLGSTLVAQEELAIDPLRDLLLAKHGVGTFALLRKIAQKSRGFLAPEDLLPTSALTADGLVEQRLCETLFDLVHGKGPVDDRFETFVKIVPSAAATWPLMTLAPALFDPSKHLFVHPGVTFRQSEILGTPVRGLGRPTGTLYAGLLSGAKKLAEALSQRGIAPRDLLDVHAFSSCSLVAPPQKRS
jgi:hypothetical protein